MDLKKLISRGKVIAKEITFQHRKTVEYRNQLVKEFTLKNYSRYVSLLAKLRRAERHEQKLEKDWWNIQEKIRKARKNYF